MLQLKDWLPFIQGLIQMPKRKGQINCQSNKLNRKRKIHKVHERIVWEVQSHKQTKNPTICLCNIQVKIAWLTSASFVKVSCNLDEKI